jgi:hypothetical protein
MTARPDLQVIKRLTVRVYEELAPCQHVVEILRTIDREFPGLSYRDFYLAVALAEHYEREVRWHDVEDTS